MNTWEFKNGILMLSYRFEEGGFDVEIDLKYLGKVSPIRVYEIPNFGGERRFLYDFDTIEKAIEYARKLT